MISAASSSSSSPSSSPAGRRTTEPFGHWLQPSPGQMHLEPLVLPHLLLLPLLLLFPFFLSAACKRKATVEMLTPSPPASHVTDRDCRLRTGDLRQRCRPRPRRWSRLCPQAGVCHELYQRCGDGPWRRQLRRSPPRVTTTSVGATLCGNEPLQHVQPSTWPIVGVRKAAVDTGVQPL